MIRDDSPLWVTLSYYILWYEESDLHSFRPDQNETQSKSLSLIFHIAPIWNQILLIGSWLGCWERGRFGISSSQVHFIISVACVSPLSHTAHFLLIHTGTHITVTNNKSKYIPAASTLQVPSGSDVALPTLSLFSTRNHTWLGCAVCCLCLCIHLGTCHQLGC